MNLYLKVIISVALAISTMAKPLKKELKFYDGFETKLFIERPKNSKDTVILFQDIGPFDHKMDVNVNGKNYSFFEEIKNIFLEKNIEVITFDKRAYVLFNRALSDPKFANSIDFKNMSEGIFDYSQEDANFVTNHIYKEKLTTKRNGKLYLFGIGQGAQFALRTAERLKDKVDGLFLVGLTGKTEEAQMASQVYFLGRSKFLRYDKNNDKAISREEIKGIKSFENVYKNFKKFDMNRDNKLSIDEIDGINYIQVIQSNPRYAATMKISLRYESLYTNLKDIKIPTVLIHGIKDLHSPVSELYSIFHLNNFEWRNTFLSFQMLINEGHYLQTHNNKGLKLLSKNAKSLLTKVIGEMKEYDNKFGKNGKKKNK